MNSAPSCSQHNPTLRSPLSSINFLGCERLSFTDPTPCVGDKHGGTLERFFEHLDELDEEDKLTAATDQTSRPTVKPDDEPPAAQNDVLERFFEHLDELDEQDKLTAAAEQDKLTAAAHPWVLNGVFKTVPYSVGLPHRRTGRACGRCARQGPSPRLSWLPVLHRTRPWTRTTLPGPKRAAELGTFLGNLSQLQGRAFCIRTDLPGR